MYNVSFIAINGVVDDDVATDGIFVDGRTSNEADDVDVATDEISAIGDGLVNNNNTIVRVFVDDAEVVVVILVVTVVAIVTGLGWDT
ncbi:hypothetical protein NDU88_002326 [Pleurodeles waltl]|uniref:Uncharacterized protein n=1 Tax=Pleurodeles waltl TaxID=8319 RepID=A0AAV7UY36_PLEWA|nr:hypothetical protein NDU88_002326 [Pleurodeles waltl]